MASLEDIAQNNLTKWLAGGRRGMSSDAMVQHLTGLDCRSGPHHPYDASDLMRCRLLLEAVPELQPEFHRMASLSGPWAEIVDHWQELCDMMDAPRQEGDAPKTTRLIQWLIDAGRRRDGWKELRPGVWAAPQKEGG